MRIGIVRDVSQAHRRWMDEALAEANYQKETVRHIGRVLSKKYDVIHYVYDDDLIGKLKEDRIDLVFNLANGYHKPQDRGELPGRLDRAGIAYTGSSALGHGICDDKALTSMILEKNQIRVPKTLQVYSTQDLAGRDLAYPLLVKPNNEGSGRGISNDSLVYDRDQLYQVVHQALLDYAPPILVTEYIDGSELTLGLLGNGKDLLALPPLEIDFSNLPEGVEKIYSFEVKHQMEEETNYYIPGRFSPELIHEIEMTGKRAYQLLELRDYSRIDMRLREGKAYILEINSLAGLHPESSDIVKTAQYLGIDYPDLIDGIVQGAMARYGIRMTPKEGPEIIERIRQIRREENEIAHQEEVEAYKRAGDLPREAKEADETQEAGQEMETFFDQLDRLEEGMARLQDQVDLLRKMAEGIKDVKKS